mmetsp:Transcript_72331/g.169379  ORF Transcript_72331/g.169379 Transcript_72331/m.169379 type:complete len:241 (-) Transcript_72331:198-920(-)
MQVFHPTTRWLFGTCCPLCRCSQAPQSAFKRLFERRPCVSGLQHLLDGLFALRLEDVVEDLRPRLLVKRLARERLQCSDTDGVNVALLIVDTISDHLRVHEANTAQRCDYCGLGTFLQRREGNQVCEPAVHELCLIVEGQHHVGRLHISMEARPTRLQSMQIRHSGANAKHDLEPRLPLQLNCKAIVPEVGVQTSCKQLVKHYVGFLILSVPQQLQYVGMGEPGQRLDLRLSEAFELLML